MYNKEFTDKSATLMLLLSRKGFWMATTSSNPMLAGKPVSVSAKITMEPSAPPPLESKNYSVGVQ